MIHAGWSDIVSLDDLSADSSISYSFDFAESKALDFKRIRVGASSVHFRTVWDERSLSHQLGESLQAAPPQRQLFKKPPAERRHPATCSLSPFQGWTPRKLEQSFLLKSSLKRPLVEEDIVLKTEEILNICHLSASQVAQLVKNPPANADKTRLRGFHPWVGTIAWRRQWQPTPVFLPRKSHGQKSLAGYSQHGRKNRTWLSMLARVILMHLCQSGILWEKCLRLVLCAKSRVPSL